MLCVAAKYRAYGLNRCISLPVFHLGHLQPLQYDSNKIKSAPISGPQVNLVEQDTIQFRVSFLKCNPPEASHYVTTHWK
jgi:hypothetical protein